MPTLTYSGTRTIQESDASNDVRVLAGALVDGIKGDMIEVNYGKIEPAPNGEIRVSVSVSIKGSYGELTTLEADLAQQIVDLGLESDTNTAAENMELE